MSVQVYGCNHVVIEVTDAKKAVQFYSDVFGLNMLRGGEGAAWCKLGEHQFMAIFEVEKLQPDRVKHFGLMVREIRQAIPDLEAVVDECLSEGNRVVTSSTLFGTLVSPILGFAPSGKIITIAAMSIWTLNPGGDIEEINTLFDLEGARQQLGMAGPIPITLPPT